MVNITVKDLKDANFPVTFMQGINPNSPVVESLLRDAQSFAGEKHGSERLAAFTEFVGRTVVPDMRKRGEIDFEKSIKEKRGVCVLCRIATTSSNER